MKRKTSQFLGFGLVLWICWNFDKVRCDEGLGASPTTTTLPKFINRPAKHRAVTGDSVVLPCQVENLDRYVILWKRGNAVLSAGSLKITVDPRIQLVDGFSLEIKKVKIHDAGDYICQISTLVPLEQTQTLEIFVPPSVRIEPKSELITVTKGETLTLQCRGNGNPTPTIHWTRKNNLLPNGEQSVEGNSFSIQKADRHQAGVYVCSASNGVGTPDTAAIQVKVQYPPEIEVERSWIHGGEGAEATLVCIVHADPAASVWWYRDTMTLDTSDRRLFEEHGARRSLIIRRVKADDFGNYSCVADNKLGRSKKHMELSGKPNQPVFRSESKGRMRESFNITWSVESYSPLSEYRLLYRRGGGNQTHEKSLSGEWNDVIIPATDYTFSSGSSIGGLPKTGASSSPSNLHLKSYVIKNLEAETSYEAIVSAKNKFGYSLKSDSFGFVTRKTDMHPYESSPQHDVSAGDPEVRDLGITAASSQAITIHPLPATKGSLPLILLLTLVSASLTFILQVSSTGFSLNNPSRHLRRNELELD